MPVRFRAELQVELSLVITRYFQLTSVRWNLSYAWILPLAFPIWRSWTYRRISIACLFRPTQTLVLDAKTVERRLEFPVLALTLTSCIQIPVCLRLSLPPSLTLDPAYSPRKSPGTTAQPRAQSLTTTRPAQWTCKRCSLRSRRPISRTPLCR
ncbi:hypothetical protein B0H10DRAFT_2041800 [Mycena sp. CBHHK59/15]|nr:hypothetical protein B0H10DRAFT_2041800 [Mycena sp. CBHHK59/15]